MVDPMTIFIVGVAVWLLFVAAVCVVLTRHGVRARDREASMRRHPTNTTTPKDQP
jgi:hypothetical protein